MQGENAERWRKLCERAVVERDHERLMQLIQEINQLLEAKEANLQQKQAKGKSAA